VPDYLSLQGYSPTKSTAVTPLQLLNSAIWISLSVPLRWKFCQDPFRPPPVLLVYQYPSPTFSQWTVCPKGGMPETSFRAGLELNSCGLEHGHRLIGQSDGHSATLLGQQDTRVQMRCWLCREQYSLLIWYFLDRAPCRHPHATEPLQHLGRSFFYPHDLFQLPWGRLGW